MGWAALLELILRVAPAGLMTAGGLGGWLVAAASTHVALGLAIGLALDRVPGLRARPPLACAIIATSMIALAALVDGDLIASGPIAVGGLFAWSRWRFPGQPSRGRAAARVAFFGSLAAFLLWLGGRPLAPWSWGGGEVRGARSVLVVVLDTVRRDHTSAYGYPRDTTPHLDALADRGGAWAGWSNACWSLPGHATMLTGRYAGRHGAHYEGGAMDEALPTLQGAFAAAGYDTLLVTGNPWVNLENNVGAGFGARVETWGRAVVPMGVFGLRLTRPLWDQDGDKGGASGARAFARWLDARPDPQRPFFAFVNVMEAHAPYHAAPPASRERYLTTAYGPADKALSEASLFHHLGGGEPPSDPDRLVDLYDGAVRAADAVLGELLAALAARGLADEVAVVVTSDHGEHFGEHGLWGHVHGLYEEVLQVPFVVAGPGVGPATPGAPARLVDLAPTALALAGVDLPLRPETAGRPVADARPGEPVVAEQFTPTLLGDPAGLVGDLGVFRARRRSWSDGRVKLHTAEGRGDSFYDLAADPGEAAPTLEDTPRRAEAARALAAWASAEGITWPDEIGAGPTVDGFAEEALRALGYVE